MASKATLLDAVNIIISNIGQAPVTGLETGNPLVEMAELTLNEVSRAVQVEGWVFNTEYHYPFSPDADGNITIPANVLELNTEPLSLQQARIRDGRLYNMTDHTYDWSDYDSIELDVVWLFDFEDLPEAFKNYITIRAANLFAGRNVGSNESTAYGRTEEAVARSSAIAYDAKQGRWNIFSDGTNNRMSGRTYRPNATVFIPRW